MAWTGTETPLCTIGNSNNSIVIIVVELVVVELIMFVFFMFNIVIDLIRIIHIEVIIVNAISTSITIKGNNRIIRILLIGA